MKLLQEFRIERDRFTGRGEHSLQGEEEQHAGQDPRKEKGLGHPLLHHQVSNRTILLGNLDKLPTRTASRILSGGKFLGAVCQDPNHKYSKKILQDHNYYLLMGACSCGLKLMEKITHFGCKLNNDYSAAL